MSHLDKIGGVEPRVLNPYNLPGTSSYTIPLAALSPLSTVCQSLPYGRPGRPRCEQCEHHHVVGSHHTTGVLDAHAACNVTHHVMCAHYTMHN